MRKSRKRITALILSTTMVMTAVNIPNMTVKAEEAQASEELSDFSNTLENRTVYGTKTNTYLSKTDTGYQIVLANEKIYILDFDKNWNQISERTLDYELSAFGGYYSGENYNYLVYGQSGSSAGTEIYRIVKYDKAFNRIASLSVPYEDCYTVTPFDCGNVSIAESGNKLIVYTARTRPDGHQSNIALRINTETMTIDDSYGMGSISDVHVSHSFRQIVKYDGDTPVYVDLGDGYPRAVCLQKSGLMTTMLNVDGQFGDNVTDTDVSGLEITDTGYLVVGTQVGNYCNNIYLSYAEKGKTTAKVLGLTTSSTYNYSSVCNAKIIKISDGLFAVMWNCFDGGGSVNYVMVNGQGELLSGLKSLPGAELTQCEPILDDGKVTWVKYSNGKREVYSLTDFTCTGTYEWNDTYVSPVNPWDGSIDTSWYEEGKTEFTLNTPRQLAGLAQLVNDGNTFEGKKILLGSDMFFNETDSIKNCWTPIASKSSGNCFEGTFDGQGHSLYNLYTNTGKGAGFFGTIGENGIVKAVKVSQGFLYGAAIAYENNGWILFCENNSMVNGDDGYTSGICCENKNLIYGCGNTGVVIGVNTGGIAGRNLGAASTIDSCWNQGYVAGTGSSVAGIVCDNYGWVYDCYNAGTVSGNDWLNYAKTVAGIVGGHHADYSGSKIYNCYNAGYLDINDEWNWFCSDAICGEGSSTCKNVYTLPTEYNSCATEIIWEKLKSQETVEMLRGENVIPKWCIETEDLNNGAVIPVAQQDMSDGIYKMLPDVWRGKTEVELSLADKNYQLEAFSYAYCGTEELTAVYSSDSDVLSITSDGVITPLKEGTAVVKVIFEETEYVKETSFDVTVTVTGMVGDINNDGSVNITDLMMCLYYVSGRTTLEGNALKAADVNGDGAVTIIDLMRILYYVSGRNTTL